MKDTDSEKYVLKILVLGTTPEISITEAEFSELKNSREILQEACAFEVKYESVMHNYLEMEKELVNLSITEIVRDYVGYSDMFNNRLIANNKIANLLNSARSYTDSIRKNISSCLLGDEDKTKIKELIKKEYNSNSHYRFIHELRNYTQHINFPIHKVLYGSRRDEKNMLKYHLNLFSVKKHLLKKHGVKKKILDEMEEEVSLLLYIRHYIESVSKIHITTRELMEPKITKARYCMEVAIDQYKGIHSKEEIHSMFKEYSIGLDAVHFKGSKKIETSPVMLKWDDERIRLVEKNRSCLVKLHERYATTQIDSK